MPISQELNGALRELRYKTQAALNSSIEAVDRLLDGKEPQANGHLRTAEHFAEEAIRYARQAQALLDPIEDRKNKIEAMRRRFSFYARVGNITVVHTDGTSHTTGIGVLRGYGKIK